MKPTDKVLAFKKHAWVMLRAKIQSHISKSWKDPQGPVWSKDLLQRCVCSQQLLIVHLKFLWLYTLFDYFMTLCCRI